ncbi:unnamed protein product [Caenorhabditis sp. 36 PRJEB53466]|nr:unnamed protein product [Caenorhabditis sp. 36 PRJEB53466]
MSGTYMQNDFSRSRSMSRYNDDDFPEDFLEPPKEKVTPVVTESSVPSCTASAPSRSCTPLANITTASSSNNNVDVNAGTSNSFYDNPVQFVDSLLNNHDLFLPSSPGPVTQSSHGFSSPILSGINHTVVATSNYHTTQKTNGPSMQPQQQVGNYKGFLEWSLDDEINAAAGLTSMKYGGHPVTHSGQESEETSSSVKTSAKERKSQNLDLNLDARSEMTDSEESDDDFDENDPKNSAAELTMEYIEKALDKPLGKHEKIDTKAVCARVAREIKEYNIQQTAFARNVLGRSQGTLSDLLRNPKPWALVKSGRATFIRMHNWLNLAKHKEGGRKKNEEKKARLVFTEIQKRTLDAIFKQTTHPSRKVQKAIAEHLELKFSTVSNFFMNARRRAHSHVAVSNTLEQLAPNLDIFKEEVSEIKEILK